MHTAPDLNYIFSAFVTVFILRHYKIYVYIILLTLRCVLRKTAGGTISFFAHISHTTGASGDNESFN